MKLVRIKCKDDGWSDVWAMARPFKKEFGFIYVSLDYGDGNLDKQLDVQISMYPRSKYPFGIDSASFQTIEKCESYWKITQKDVNAALSYAKQLRQKVHGKTVRDLMEGKI